MSGRQTIDAVVAGFGRSVVPELESDPHIHVLCRRGRTVARGRRCSKQICIAGERHVGLNWVSENGDPKNNVSQEHALRFPVHQHSSRE
jgi:hypothetical protein